MNNHQPTYGGRQGEEGRVWEAERGRQGEGGRVRGAKRGRQGEGGRVREAGGGDGVFQGWGWHIVIIRLFSFSFCAQREEILKNNKLIMC